VPTDDENGDENDEVDRWLDPLEERSHARGNIRYQDDEDEEELSSGEEGSMLGEEQSYLVPGFQSWLEQSREREGLSRESSHHHGQSWLGSYRNPELDQSREAIVVSDESELDMVFMDEMDMDEESDEEDDTEEDSDFEEESADLSGDSLAEDVLSEEVSHTF